MAAPSPTAKRERYQGSLHELGQVLLPFATGPGWLKYAEKPGGAKVQPQQPQLPGQALSGGLDVGPLPEGLADLWATVQAALPGHVGQAPDDASPRFAGHGEAQAASLGPGVG
eukprot:2947194-Alexandrium_andersonii.AAC.1